MKKENAANLWEEGIIKNSPIDKGIHGQRVKGNQKTDVVLTRELQLAQG